MIKEQRDDILKIARKAYEGEGCTFPSDDREMVEYLWESEHPSERNSLFLGVYAHNLYNNDNLTLDLFFEWHGL